MFWLNRCFYSNEQKKDPATGEKLQLEMVLSEGLSDYLQQSCQGWETLPATPFQGSFKAKTEAVVGRYFGFLTAAI